MGARPLDRPSKRAPAGTLRSRIRRADDGAIRWIGAHAEPQLGDNGRPIRLFGLVQDITEQRQPQEPLRETLKVQVAERTAERDRSWRLSGDMFAIWSLDDQDLASLT